MPKEYIIKALKEGLLSGTIVFIILILLQPFGIDRVEENRWLLVSGYFLIAFFIVTIFNIVVYAIGWTNLGLRDWRYWIVQAIMVVCLGASISCYASLYFTGSIMSGFCDRHGNIELTAFFFNCMYVVIVSLFINVFTFMKNKNKKMKGMLEEERLMNKTIMEQLERANKNSTPETEEKPITIAGATKESLTIAPNNLIYAVSDSNYIDIVYIDGETSVSKTLRLTMKQIEEILMPYDYIVRCHRAYIVNTKHVIHVDGNAQGYKLKMANTDNIVPVSRAYASEIYEKITGGR